MKSSRKRVPKAIDLFSGAGGLTEGLRQAGYRVVGAVESDPFACAVYRANHKQVILWKTDIRKVTGPAILKKVKLMRGQLDLLAACPPCQGFSNLRTKNGIRMNRDPRNALVLDIIRLVRSMKPKSVMLENVPGLASSSRYRSFRKGLRSLGYQIKGAVVDTADFGVPQRRKRLVLLASRLGKPEFASFARARKTVRDTIGPLVSPQRSRDPLHNHPVQRSEKVARLIRRIPPNGGSRSDLGQRAQLKCHKKSDGFRDVYGRMSWDKPSPTITGGCINPSKGRFLHPRANRAITLREAALLQSFPKRYRFPLDKGGKYRVALLIGNALPPEFIRRHALTLRKSLSTGGAGVLR
jgi:DNA (cytosine-5)-methyltransferase 1